MKYSELKQKVLKRNALIKVIKNIVPVLNVSTTIVKKQATLLINKFDWVEVGRDYKSFYVKFDNIKLRGSRVYHLWDIYVCFSKGSQTYPKITYYNIAPHSNEEELLCYGMEYDSIADMVNYELLIPARHPHISTGTGDACLGDFEKPIYNCLGIYNYAAALLTIKQFLLSWNVNSPYWNVNDCYNYFFRAERGYKYLTYAELVYIYISEWGRNANIVADICESVKRKTGKFDESWIDKVNRFQVCQQDRLDRFLADLVSDVVIDKHPFLEMWHRIVKLKGTDWTWGSNAQTSIANCEKLDLVYSDFRTVISSFRTKASHTFSKFDIIFYYYNHPLGNQWRRSHWDIIMKKRMEQILNQTINEVALTGSSVPAATKRRLLRSRGIEALFQEGINLDNVDKLLYDSGIIAYRMAIKNSKEAIRRLKNEVDDFKASFDQT